MQIKLKIISTIYTLLYYSTLYYLFTLFSKLLIFSFRKRDLFLTFLTFTIKLLNKETPYNRRLTITYNYYFTLYFLRLTSLLYSTSKEILKMLTKASFISTTINNSLVVKPTKVDSTIKAIINNYRTFKNRYKVTLNYLRKGKIELEYLFLLENNTIDKLVFFLKILILLEALLSLETLI
ncbi:hypothetical protein FB567DRAFT_547054 [Paraphoma chrysanthemicola]|uniref:Uncharacterized protein n=1 Tax=Paraphoma chrysanthemicola TaxID=798071 RepID=A0A8K0RBY5_9PLEO|nr:hypothetical protein FB567DRAFT_547054 [Paraphoma chrysanthemicola]